MQIVVFNRFLLTMNLARTQYKFLENGYGIWEEDFCTVEVAYQRYLQVNGITSRDTFIVIWPKRYKIDNHWFVIFLE